MAKSTQHLLDKNRKPRVHITYDVEINGAKVERELPFVIGIMADLSGRPAKPLPRMADREFLPIDAENFDAVLAGAAPRLVLNVEDTLGGEGTVDVTVNFQSLADFTPDRVAESVAEGNEPLRRLLDERRQLAELLNGIEGTPRFGEALQEILTDRAKREQLQSEVGPGVGRPGGEPDGR